MSAVIEIDGLGKRYSLAVDRPAPYGTLRDELASLVRRRGGPRRNRGREDFWALRDVSFDVERGDVVGIIGRNGSGKSTLLKILAQIVDPTAGTALLRGRTASLLEVGTGFHPELTGRENVFFNGSILGMTRREIAARFDAIVEFAETERFLDTPVKFYSSGMQVRLAFAVAAHLEPEILVVDEVLAVGDAHFQKKCLGKMHSVAGEGRTVLFVSHSMSTIRSLCNRGVLLDAGRPAFIGDIHDAVAAYSAILTARDTLTPVGDRPRDPSLSGEARIVGVEVRAPSDRQPIPSEEPLTIAFDVECRKAVKGVALHFVITAAGQNVLRFHSEHSRITFDLHRGRNRITCSTDRSRLVGGLYDIDASLLFEGRDQSSHIDFVGECFAFQVAEPVLTDPQAMLTQREAVFHLAHEWAAEG